MLKKADGGIAERARFDEIRYAQVWEDADILREALCVRPGNTVLSIGSAGDNALALLVEDPAKVVVLDLSTPQIHCIRLRMAAYEALDYVEFLELIGSHPSSRRDEILDKVLRRLEPDAQAFWEQRRELVRLHGAGGVGKFERYFRIFRTWVLPLVHPRERVDQLLTSRDRTARVEFFNSVWNNRRWRLMLSLFFSNATMGALGRDPAFFDHVQGSLSDQVFARTCHAFVELDPARNPYLHWILRGTHGEELPTALRAEYFGTIRSRLDRIVIENRSIESMPADLRIDRFNLSDIFEYLDASAFERLYGQILDMAAPGARLVYWNMMVPRSCPPAHADRVRPVPSASKMLHELDRAFFYSALVVEDVR